MPQKLSIAVFVFIAIFSHFKKWETSSSFMHIAGNFLPAQDVGAILEKTTSRTVWLVLIEAFFLMNCRPFSTSSYRLANVTQTSTELNFNSTDGPKVTTWEHSNEEENGLKVTRSPSTRHIDLNANDCSKYNTDCPSGCCIDGQCVNNSRCAPVKAPRGGPPPPPPGGGVKIGIKSSFPAWGIFVGMFALLFTSTCIYCCCERYKQMKIRSFIRARRNSTSHNPP